MKPKIKHGKKGPRKIKNHHVRSDKRWEHYIRLMYLYSHPDCPPEKKHCYLVQLKQAAIALDRRWENDKTLVFFRQDAIEAVGADKYYEITSTPPPWQKK